jgi:ATP-dependent DNA helicase DinG
LICTKCHVVLPPLKTKSCPSCGGELRYSAEDILGDSEMRIVSEIRPPQIELAKTVEEALLKNKNAVTEAGTGTGKSLALVVPAVLAGKRVLISTATTLLQHQYMTKDLPFLLANIANLGHQFRFAVAKGRSHYVCKKKLRLFAFGLDKETVHGSFAKACAFYKEKIKEGKKESKVPNSLLTWAVESEFGDKLELGEDVPKYWSRINAEECAGASHCIDNETCGLVAARSLLKEADVIVANHAIVGFDMKLGGRLLPVHNFYIMDEAHQAAQYFRRAFASTLRETGIPSALGYLEGEAKVLPPGSEYDKLVEDLRKGNKALFKKFPKRTDGSFDLFDGEELVDDLDSMIDLMSDLIKPFAAESRSRDLSKRCKDKESAAYMVAVANDKRAADAERDSYLKNVRDDVIITAARKLQRVAESLRGIRSAATNEDETDPHILYIQFPRTNKQSREIVYSPVFVNRILKSNLFPRTQVVASSATLAINGNFDCFKEEMGFSNDVITYITSSPFDYERRALLYCSKNVPIHPARAKTPRHLMEKKLEEYYDAMTDEIVGLTSASGGHAFILFTSRVEMKEVGQRLVDESDFPVRMQEEGMATGDLEMWFRETDNPILCGLKSFWEGVSIEGEQLRLVVITKAPFPMQGDPVYQAQKDIMEKRYGSWYKRFKKLDIPAMITDVKQGTGRLIRTKLDYGVAAILDRKVSNDANKPGSYAALLINSLPFTLITANIGDVKKFLRQFEQGKKKK